MFAIKPAEQNWTSGIPSGPALEPFMLSARTRGGGMSRVCGPAIVAAASFHSATVVCQNGISSTHSSDQYG